jgi:hypothetical protein
VTVDGKRWSQLFSVDDLLETTPNNTVFLLSSGVKFSEERLDRFGNFVIALPALVLDEGRTPQDCQGRRRPARLSVPPRRARLANAWIAITLDTAGSTRQGRGVRTAESSRSIATSQARKNGLAHPCIAHGAERQYRDDDRRVETFEQRLLQIREEHDGQQEEQIQDHTE